MTCGLCNTSIKNGERVNAHHPLYRSNGGIETIPTHEQCHRELHSKRGDFRAWGKKAASKKRWAFHLKNVRTHPAYEEARWFYLMNYADAGWAEGL